MTIDNVEYDPFLKSIFDLFQSQYEKLQDAEYSYSRSQSFVVGLEKFRKERRTTINLLQEYIGREEASEFASLPSFILNHHPSMLAVDYSYREFGEHEIESHIKFLKVIIEGVKDGSIGLHGTKMKGKREKVLLELYELYKKDRAYESFDDLHIATNIDIFELNHILEYLKEKDLINESYPEYSITSKGIREVESMKKNEQETPEQKRFRVLKTIYDLSEANPSEIILYETIEQETGIDSNKVIGILQYLDQRNLIHMGGEWAQITSDGIDQIETVRNHPEKSTRYFPANIYNNTFNAPVTGMMQGGEKNSQSNIQNLHSDFNVAIEKLLMLVENSSLSPLQKIKTKSDIITIKELEGLEKTPDVIEVASSKIEAIKDVISMTADMTSLGIILIQIIQAAFNL